MLLQTRALLVPALPPLVGIITGSSRPGLRYFLNDPGRYPGYGGGDPT